MIGWRAWFVGDVLTSADTDHDDLPEDECLLVLVYTGLDTPKRFTHSGEDRYLWWESPHGLLVASNSDSPEENERRYPGAKIVRGKWTTPERMAEVRREAQEAHECP